MKTLFRALTRGGIAAVFFRFAGVLCSIGGIALLWVNVQQVHNTGSHTDSGLTELGLSVSTVGLWFCILSVALVGQSQRDQQNNPLVIPLWLLIAGASVVTCLTVTVAILVFPGIVSGRPTEARTDGIRSHAGAGSNQSDLLHWRLNGKRHSAGSPQR